MAAGRRHPSELVPRELLHDMLCWVGLSSLSNGSGVSDIGLPMRRHCWTSTSLLPLARATRAGYIIPAAEHCATTSHCSYKLWLSSQNYSPLMLHTHTARAAGDTGKTKKSRWPNHSVLNFIYTWLMEMSNGPLPWCRLISNKKLQQSFSWYEIWSGLSFLLLLMKSLELIFKEL